MVLGLFVILIPVLLIIFVINFALKSNEKGGESVFRHLYIYLVLFATLMMVIGGGISIFMAAADLVSPPSYYQSYEEYKMMKQSEVTKEENEKALTEEELRASYEQAVKDEQNRTKVQAKNQIIKSLGFIVIPLPVFLYFNKLRKKHGEV
ncbi:MULTISPECIES: hypothetical protein [Neobacillus]|uniref:Uncharacterized protein n=2 Tax=Neobacillus TaxID=2675232 RepID=A0A6B3TNA7_9BACI|nr:hypothetical protein [Neobacillus sedimentimangrovi]MCD4837418.1 hypothetical protein [Neobacillus sedimentimangrovi]NEX77740.1 hypothetical protein [Neobacillus thermocopriae]